MTQTRRRAAVCIFYDDIGPFACFRIRTYAFALERVRQISTCDEIFDGGGNISSLDTEENRDIKLGIGQLTTGTCFGGLGGRSGRCGSCCRGFSNFNFLTC